jgi:hypothetical protein
MEYTDQYVYVNVTDAIAAEINDELRVVLNYNNDRVPYALVEVISFSIKTSTATNNIFTLKTAENAQNYLGYDNMGTALAIAPFNTDVAAGHHLYAMYGSGSKVMFANPRSLTFYITNDNNVKQAIGVPEVIENYTMLLKVSYPKVGEIQPLYRSQIPL